MRKINKLLVDEFATSLIPTDLTTLLPDRDWDSESEDCELLAVRSSANGNCLFNSISILLKGLSFLFFLFRNNLACHHSMFFLTAPVPWIRYCTFLTCSVQCQY